MGKRTVVLLGLALCVALAADLHASEAAQAGAAKAAPIVYGYRFGARCPGAGLAQIVDPWGMYECNCTSFVAWALTVNRERTDWFIRGSMDAWNWPNVARIAGLRVDHAPAVGAVAVWPNLARPFGHVAYVSGLGPGNTIDVAEYNFPGLNGFESFGFDTRSFVPHGGAVFIHVPPRQLSRD
jgi:hypothetical protein